jgi:hypothetical protein
MAGPWDRPMIDIAERIVLTGALGCAEFGAVAVFR